jgi:hypothetical protein
MIVEDEIIEQTIAVLESLRNRKRAISQLGAALIKMGHDPISDEMDYIRKCIREAIYLLNGDIA